MPSPRVTWAAAKTVTIQARTVPATRKMPRMAETKLSATCQPCPNRSRPLLTKGMPLKPPEDGRAPPPRRTGFQPRLYARATVRACMAAAVGFEAPSRPPVRSVASGRFHAEVWNDAVRRATVKEAAGQPALPLGVVGDRLFESGALLCPRRGRGLGA